MPTRPHRALLAALVFGGAASAIACGHDAAPREVTPRYDASNGRLAQLVYDSNHDGKPDMTAFMDGAAVRAVEVDENHDGRVDRWEHYAAPKPGAASDEPVLVSVDRATHHNGKVDRREGFVDGVLAWAEEDRDGDGNVDRWETYEGGALSSLATDSRHLGVPERRIDYGPDGELVAAQSPEPAP